MREKFCGCIKEVLGQPSKTSMADYFQRTMNTDEDFLASLGSFTKHYFNASIRKLNGISQEEISLLGKEIFSNSNNPSELLKRTVPNIFDFEIRIFCFDIIANRPLKEEYYPITTKASGQSKPQTLDLLCTLTAVPTFYSLMRDPDT